MTWSAPVDLELQEQSISDNNIIPIYKIIRFIYSMHTKYIIVTVGIEFFKLTTAILMHILN